MSAGRCLPLRSTATLRITAGGLAFIAGKLDPAIRAFDISTGKEVWKGDLPISARSTSMRFSGPDGKQYLLISGRPRIEGGPPLGDYLVAFCARELGNHHGR
jgi:quinoprotein glucose dehydrogenase